MAQPLNYERKPIEPAVPTSRAAVAGCCLGIVGPVPGALLAIAAETVLRVHLEDRFAIVMFPLATGLVLSLIGLRETASPRKRKGGRRFAAVGAGLGLAWCAFILFTFATLVI